MTLSTLLFSGLSIFYAAVILFFYFGILRAKKRSVMPSARRPIVSVLIPARNESQTILSTLESLACQDYPVDRFEVIVIDDQSTDATSDLARRYIAQHQLSHFRVICHQHQESQPTFKKTAIAYGLNVSRGEIILTTDADCRVLPTWVSSMAAHFDAETGLVAGLVRYDMPESPRLIHRLQALEFAGLVYCGVGAIGNNYPLICNASNLAYRREVYDQIGGFSGHQNIPSGDDDLFMQNVHHKTEWQVRYNLSRDAINSTAPVDSPGEFLNQRARWASKGTHYPNPLTVFLLLAIYLYYLGLLVLTPVTIFGSFPADILVIAICCKLIPEFLVVRQALNGLNSPGLMRFFAIAQLVQVPYIVVAGFAGFFNIFRWKRPI